MLTVLEQLIRIVQFAEVTEVFGMSMVLLLGIAVVALAVILIAVAVIGRR